jgi:adenine-specific DNA methylase
MRHWGSEQLGLCSAESYGRFLAIQRNPEKLADDIALRGALLDFIADFANWDNSTSSAYLKTSRTLSEVAHEALGGTPGTRPLVVDPFVGGGSIPLEALRVGADSFASDLNPVAVLLSKVTLEYIPKYGQRLADEVRKWGDLIKSEAEKELATFYPRDGDGAIPIAYLWARTIQCEGPGCGAEVPLLRSTNLSAKSPVAHVEVRAGKDREIDVNLQSGKEIRSTATVRGGKATCPVCGFTTPEKRVKDQTSNKNGGGNSARLFAVLTQKGSERQFRKPSQSDLSAIEAAKDCYGISTRIRSDLFPTEEINPLRPYKNTVGVCIVTRMGIRRFLDLYTSRQALSLVAFQRAIHKVASAQVNEDQLADAICLSIHLAFDRLVMQNTSLSRWDSSRSTIKGLFSKQALQVVWDFAEANPLGPGTGNWDGAVEWIAKVIEANAGIDGQGTAVRASADELPLPNESADLLFTDPPYFAAIPYADLSDVFYVWLRRSLGGTHPDLFRSALVEKEKELIVTNSSRGENGAIKDNVFFSKGMELALERGRLVIRPDALGCIVFADASTDAWEAILSAVIGAGWKLTASWPIDTEMQNRTRARSSASLQSSVFMVCRPRANSDGSVSMDEIGDWRDVLAELPHRIHEWMPRLAEEGVVGADAIFACLGPALEIFSRHSSVEKASGEPVTLKEYLEQVWAAVAKEALAMVFEGADASGFEADARLTAMWLWTLKGESNGAGERVDELVEGNEEEEGEEGDEGESSKPKVGGFMLEYDAARKIAQGLGARLEALGSIVEVRGERARLLPVAERARYLFGKEETDPRGFGRKRKAVQMDLFSALAETELDEVAWPGSGAWRKGETTLDQLHQSMILFGAGRGEAFKRFVVDERVGQDARFWRLAQALSALFPIGTEEKRWVDGVLARKKGLGF